MKKEKEKEKESAAKEKKKKSTSIAALQNRELRRWPALAAASLSKLCENQPALSPSQEALFSSLLNAASQEIQEVGAPEKCGGNIRGENKGECERERKGREKGGSGGEPEGIPRARLGLYLAGLLDGRKCREALADAGMSWGEVQLCRKIWPALDRAIEAALTARREFLAAKAEDAIDGLLSGEKGDFRAAAFCLERLRATRKAYEPPPRLAAAPQQSGDQIIYNISFGGNGAKAAQKPAIDIGEG